MQPDIAQTRPSRLSKAQRAEAVVLYELGLFNRAQLARHYGVRRDLIDRHLKAVGAVKGRRMGARIDHLNARVEERQETRRQAEARRREAAKSNLAFLDRFMEALLKAEREGRLVEFGQRLPRL